MIRSGKYVKPTANDFPSAAENKGSLAQALDTGVIYWSDGASWIDMVKTPFGTTTVSTTAANTLKVGPGKLKSFTVLAKGTTPTLQIFDNTTNSGTKLIPDLNGTSAVGDFPALDIGETYVWTEPLIFSNGCTVVIGGTGTTTIQFQFN